VLHPWGQTLSQHLHIHALVAAGALAPDGHWITSRRGFLFPVTALSPVFRGKFLARLKQPFSAGTLKLAGWCAPLADPTAQRQMLRELREKPWAVYAKRPSAGPHRAPRHASTGTISGAPRSESSGSVQPILSTMLPHDG